MFIIGPPVDASGIELASSLWDMNENQKMVLFKSQNDIAAALEALSFRQEELSDAMTTLLHFLVPQVDRRSGQVRRSGSDRRAARESAQGERRQKSDRRTMQDRRQPPYERLRYLRREMEQVIQLQELVNGWRLSISD